MNKDLISDSVNSDSSTLYRSLMIPVTPFDNAVTSSSLLAGIMIYIFMGILGLLIPFFEWIKWLSITSLTSIWSEIILEGDLSHLLGHSLGLIAWTLSSTMLGIAIFQRRDI